MRYQLFCREEEKKRVKCTVSLLTCKQPSFRSINSKTAFFRSINFLSGSPWVHTLRLILKFMYNLLVHVFFSQSSGIISLPAQGTSSQ
jgi:hypothetical protein